MLLQREHLGFRVEMGDRRGSGAARRNAEGRVLRALQSFHVGRGQVRTPSRAGVFQHRPDELLVEGSLSLFLVAERGGGQGLHHVQPWFGPGNDFLAVGPKSHAPIQGHSQDLCGGADWDGSAPQGDYRFKPVLTRMWGEEGDGGFVGRNLHPILVEPLFQLVDVALEVFRRYIHLVMLGDDGEVVSI